MDVLSDLLHRARAQTALVRQLVQRPPWSLTFADAPPLTVVATLGGHATIRLDDDAASVRLAAGDIALISATGRYTIADPPSAPPQVVIQGQQKYVARRFRRTLHQPGRRAPAHLPHQLADDLGGGPAP
ncbi:cupin domain-containing protein [Microtetraspora malaysiensis]|uniref:cupin domain-containing protein n=1 Tax=Microtetraspora malaysiensis TaxID=161358 RepID=UPI003D90D2F2